MQLTKKQTDLILGLQSRGVSNSYRSEFIRYFYLVNTLEEKLKTLLEVAKLDDNSPRPLALAIENELKGVKL